MAEYFKTGGGGPKGGASRAFYLDTVETTCAPQVNKGVFTLKDVNRYGKERDWRGLKRTSRAIAAATLRVAARTNDEHLHKVGGRIFTCADRLSFADVVGADGKPGRKLIGAHFCRDRLCPMCQERKSLKTYATMKSVLEWVKTNNPTLQPLFVTMTVKNCSDDELRQTLRGLSSSFTRLMKQRQIKRVVVGYFRAIEVSHNDVTGMWHPHVHAILLVESSYFHDTKLYIEQSGWAACWADAAKLDYTPVVDVRKLEQREGHGDPVLEATKYAVKPDVYLTDDRDEMEHRVIVLRDALAGLRLVSWGGILAQGKKALKLKDGDEVSTDADLIETGADIVEPTDEITRICTYNWDSVATDYILIEMEGPRVNGMEREVLWVADRIE